MWGPPVLSVSPPPTAANYLAGPPVNLPSAAPQAEIAANEHEALQLEAQQQHLKRQSAALLERIGRLDHQARPSHITLVHKPSVANPEPQEARGAQNPNAQNESEDHGPSGGGVLPSDSEIRSSSWQN